MQTIGGFGPGGGDDNPSERRSRGQIGGPIDDISAGGFNPNPANLYPTLPSFLPGDDEAPREGEGATNINTRYGPGAGDEAPPETWEYMPAQFR